jgi:hypothetical protein
LRNALTALSTTHIIADQPNRYLKAEISPNSTIEIVFDEAGWASTRLCMAEMKKRQMEKAKDDAFGYLLEQGKVPVEFRTMENGNYVRCANEGNVVDLYDLRTQFDATAKTGEVSLSLLNPNSPLRTADEKALIQAINANTKASATH